MTRRGLLCALAIAVPTALALAFAPMTANPLAVLAAWVGSVLLALVVAAQVDELAWRRSERAQRNQVLTEARRVLGGRG